MTRHAEIEQAIAGLLEQYAVGFGNVTTGPLTQPSVEGSGRSASVRLIGGRSSRLDYGQSQWDETTLLTIFWHREIERSTALAEFEAFSDALAADQYLGGAVLGLEDAWLSRAAWSDAADGAFLVMAAEISTARIV